MELSVPGLFQNVDLSLLVHEIGIQLDNCLKCLPVRRTVILTSLAFDVFPNTLKTSIIGAMLSSGIIEAERSTLGVLYYRG